MRFLGNKVLLTALFAFMMIMSFNDCRAEWGQCSFEPPCDNNFQPYYPTGDLNVGESCCPPCALPCESPCGTPCAMPYGFPCGTSCAMPCTAPCAAPCAMPCGSPCGTPCAMPSVAPCPAPCAMPCGSSCGTPCAMPSAAPCPAPCAMPCGSPYGTPCAMPCGTPCAMPCGFPCGTPCAAPCALPCASPCNVPTCCTYPSAYPSGYFNTSYDFTNDGYDYYSHNYGYGYPYGGYFGRWGYGNYRRGSGPLCPCHFNFTIRGGVAPGVITQREEGKIRNFVGIAEATLVVTTTSVTLTTTETLTVQTAEKRAPDFFDQFNTPWTAGGEISYALTCNTEIFVDGNYLAADGRRNHYRIEFPAITSTSVPTPVTVLPAETIRIKEKFSDLRSYDGYLGARYYFNRCCGASLFLGAKLGFRHWHEVTAKVRAHTTFVNPTTGVTETVTTDFGKHHYYPSSWVVSAGIQAGLNFCISPCLSVVFMAEAVASGTFKFGENQVAPNLSFPSPGASGVAPTTLQATATQTALEVPVRKFGTIFVFPVTLGIRYTF